MSYQVLARKYRPANFQELEGQEHVLRALVNSLEQNRLHHAYLFTGTRGVGKTTIARILAKCLNCETGVTATPCGECGSCVEIAEGRSVDLIELDAASRTGVDDMRDLLDNTQYMPTRSRFKVYLIDEVHMLSKSSFNALLKTLEEPPEHVKFLFATTDPKKLPITVLSRCLQFNLKNMSPERVVNHLKKVLDEEGITYEENAIWQLGRAADGSMRDALSLTDQAISFGNNALGDDDVREMLGTIDQREVYDLLDALIERNAARLLDRIAALSEFAPDYELLLAELLSVLHRVAVAQAVPDGIDNSQGDRELVVAVSKALRPEDVQLYYQIGLIGQRDLPLAPEPRDGFEMVMLRMLSFVPEEMTGDRGDADEGSTPEKEERASQDDGKVEPASASPIASILTTINGGAAPAKSRKPKESKESKEPKASKASREQTDSGQTPVEPAPPVENKTSAEKKMSAEQAAEEDSEDIPWGDTTVVKEIETEVTPGEVIEAVAETPDEQVATTASAKSTIEPAEWVEIFGRLQLSGVTRTLAANCMLSSADADRWVLVLNEHHASLWNGTHETRIGEALTKEFGRQIKLQIEVGSTDRETPAEAQARQDGERKEQAITTIENDENVQQLIDTFDGTLDVDSIVPRKQAGEQ
jgi:DNA polymerase-3 subunit gamma/tau